MSSLCILHVIFSSRIAGSERYCIDLANRQSVDGHKVHVAGLFRSPIAKLLASPIEFHGFWPIPFRAWRLSQLAAKLEVDICHSHLSGACKALSKMKGRHRSIATLHVGYKPHQHAALDALICVNHAQTSRLHDYRGLVRTIPNWLPEPTPFLAEANLRRELGLEARAFVVGAVGRLHQSKGMDVLIKAFRTGAAKDAALVIVGEGRERAQLMRLCEGDRRIHLIGFRADVRVCLRNFDLFVSPSREESFGLAILEAMESGTPIITTATEGPTEFLRDQPVTFVPPSSVSALTEAIRQAHARFLTGTLRRIDYDLSGFDAAERMANIADLYAETMETPQRN